MKEQPIYIVDIFEDIVKNVSTELTTELKAYDPTITGVHFMAGHPLEIVNRLQKRSESGSLEFAKYPLVALFMDFPEPKGRKIGTSEVNLHLMIARGTSNTLSTKLAGIDNDRYKANFKPVLYPIYESLLRHIHLVGYNFYKPFQTEDATMIEHTKIDRPFWGRETFLRNEANKFTDYLDAIEIRDLKLIVNQKNC